MIRVLLILTMALAFSVSSEAVAFEVGVPVFEVCDVYDIDLGAALLPFDGPELVAPHGADNDCDGDERAPAMREPDHWRYLCDSTAGLHRCLMVRHSYLEIAPST